VRITRNIRVIHPPLALPGFGGGGGGGGEAMRAKMHAKLMLLRYRDDILRVVVTSANLAQPVPARLPLVRVCVCVRVCVRARACLAH
jgi:hypothetical protein